MNYLPQGTGCFKTASGIIINVIDPKPKMIELYDIVQGLAYKAHFSGQINKYFSIAEHCTLTERLVANSHPDDHELRLIALLHDASEAYIGDMISPIKMLFPEFKKMENKLQEVIFDKFGLPYSRMRDVKTFDLAAQDHEATVFYENMELGKEHYHKSESYLNFLQPNEAAVDFTARIRIRIAKLKK